MDNQKQISIAETTDTALEAETLKAAAALRASLSRSDDDQLSLIELHPQLKALEAIGLRRASRSASDAASGKPGVALPLPQPGVIKGSRQSDVLIGTPSSDRIYGYGGNDIIIALSGDDTVDGGSGDDLILAGSGNDKVQGGSGADLIFGGTGNDHLSGNAGVDVISGEAGDDVIDGGAGKDRLFGNEGRDRLNGGNGADILNGGAEDDRLNGGRGSDRLFGGSGNDRLAGGSGNDLLNGDDGDDELRGGSGNDRLFGGAGNDKAYGDAGRDRFIGSSGSDQFNGGAGHDTADYGGLGGQVTFRVDVEVIPNQPKPFSGFTRKLTYQVSKPDNGIDTINDVETLIGAKGQVNTIDFSDTDRYTRAPILNGVDLIGAPAIQVNLAKKRLIAGDQTFKVVNFKNVIGTLNNDKLVGDDQDNVLTHGPKKTILGTSTALLDQDEMNGGGGNDLLVSNGGDRLTGGSGADEFLLTTTAYQRVFRGGASTVVTGPSIITDFNRAQGDKLLVDNRGPSGSSIGFFNPGQLQNGQLPSEQLTIIESGPAPDDAVFTYNKGTGELFFRGLNLNSRFPGFQTYHVATFQGSPDLQASDIRVV